MDGGNEPGQADGRTDGVGEDEQRRDKGRGRTDEVIQPRPGRIGLMTWPEKVGRSHLFLSFQSYSLLHFSILLFLEGGPWLYDLLPNTSVPITELTSADNFRLPVPEIVNNVLGDGHWVTNYLKSSAIYTATDYFK